MQRTPFSPPLVKEEEGFLERMEEIIQKENQRDKDPGICGEVKPRDKYGWKVSVQPAGPGRQVWSPQAKALPGAGAGCGSGASPWDAAQQPPHCGASTRLQHKDDGKLARASVNFMRLRNIMMDEGFTDKRVE